MRLLRPYGRGLRLGAVGRGTDGAEGGLVAPRMRLLRLCGAGFATGGSQRRH